MPDQSRKFIPRNIAWKAIKEFKELIKEGLRYFLKQVRWKASNRRSGTAIYREM